MSSPVWVVPRHARTHPRCQIAEGVTRHNERINQVHVPTPIASTEASSHLAVPKTAPRSNLWVDMIYRGSGEDPAKSLRSNCLWIDRLLMRGRACPHESKSHVFVSRRVHHNLFNLRRLPVPLSPQSLCMRPFTCAI
jgi:hypothetical protein